MRELNIIRASELGDGARGQMSQLFVEGFGKHFLFFSKDTKRLAAAFAHIFRLEVFYLAVEDGHIVGMAACTDGLCTSVRISSPCFRKHLGYYKGTLAGLFLKNELENHPYPFPIAQGEQIGSVEYVVVGQAHRGTGVGAALLRHIHALPQYQSFVLEVADTNLPALRLYQKQGYREFLRVKQKHTKYSGINELIYMRYAAK